MPSPYVRDDPLPGLGLSPVCSDQAVIFAATPGHSVTDELTSELPFEVTEYPVRLTIATTATRDTQPAVHLATCLRGCTPGSERFVDFTGDHAPPAYYVSSVYKTGELKGLFKLKHTYWPDATHEGECGSSLQSGRYERHYALVFAPTTVLATSVPRGPGGQPTTISSLPSSGELTVPGWTHDSLSATLGQPDGLQYQECRDLRNWKTLSHCTDGHFVGDDGAKLKGLTVLLTAGEVLGEIKGAEIFHIPPPPATSGTTR